jgi:hypothetical protein
VPPPSTLTGAGKTQVLSNEELDTEGPGRGQARRLVVGEHLGSLQREEPGGLLGAEGRGAEVPALSEQALGPQAVHTIP